MIMGGKLLVCLVWIFSMYGKWGGIFFDVREIGLLFVDGNFSINGLGVTTEDQYSRC